MNKKILATLLSCFLVTGMAFGAVSSVDAEKGIISVNSDTTREVAPNVAQVYLTVESENKDMQKAISENKARSLAAIEAIKKNIDTGKGEDIKTIAYSVSPQYSYVKEKRIFENYKVVNTLVVKVKNIDNIGKIIGAATSNGVNRVENMSFTLENYSQVCNSLMSEAAQSARTSADSIAAGLGFKVRGIKNINAVCRSESSSSRALYKSAAFATNDAAVAEGASVPMEAGKIKIYANVSAQFFAN